MVISPVSPNFSKMIPALNPIFAFSMIKFIFEWFKNMYIFYYSNRVEIQIRICLLYTSGREGDKYG